jgi:hypothetical protein
MHRLKIQRVRRVPPIPTTIIVIPNVQLSMLNYLLMIYRDHGPKKKDFTFYRSNIEQKVKARVGASRKEMPRESGKAI